MAAQAYLAHQSALAEGQFIDIGMRKSRSVREVVSGGISAGKDFCKTNTLPKKPEAGPPETISALPVAEKAPKIAPPRPARDPGWFGVPGEPVRQGSQDSNCTITPEAWLRNRTPRAGEVMPSDPEAYRRNFELRDQDGLF